MIVSFTGYHGTSKTKCENILKCNYFTRSDGEDEWLGYGIYFFDRSEWYAIWWAREYKHYNPYSVIQADINVDKDNILDLTVPSNLTELDDIASILIHNKKIRTKRFADKSINDNIVINYIYNNIRKFDLVIGIFDFYKYTRKRFDNSFYVSRLKAHQIQLCVRNNSCISNVKEVCC